MLDEYGGEVQGWVSLYRFRARKFEVSDVEKNSASQVKAVKMTRFAIVYSNKSELLTTQDRIFYKGEYWSISGIKEAFRERRRYFEISAYTDKQ